MVRLLFLFLHLADGREDGNVLTGTGGLNEKVSLYKGDITVLELDAIVNAGKYFAFGLIKRLLVNVCARRCLICQHVVAIVFCS